MAEPASFNFELAEVVEALALKQGIKSGRWTVGLEFGFGAALAGPSAEGQRPTAFVQVNKITLIPAEAQTPPHLIFEVAAKPTASPSANAGRGRKRKMPA